MRKEDIKFYIKTCVFLDFKKALAIKSKLTTVKRERNRAIKMKELDSLILPTLVTLKQNMTLNSSDSH